MDPKSQSDTAQLPGALPAGTGEAISAWVNHGELPAGHPPYWEVCKLRPMSYWSIFGFPVNDKSMEPIFDLGDDVECDMCLPVKSGDAALVSLKNGRVLIREVYPTDDGEALRLVAHNPIWPDQTVKYADIQYCFPVVGRYLK